MASSTVTCPALHERRRGLVDRLNAQRLHETEVTITGKLARGAFSAAFVLACIAALEMEGRLEDL